jgi:putative transcriptional regulator
VRITQHLSVPTLLSYAAGTLEQPLAIVVAAHLNWCADCRDHLADMEMVGAVLLADLEPAAISTVAAMPVDATAASPTILPPRTDDTSRDALHDAPDGFSLPAPLDTLAGRNSDLIRWRYLAPGIQSYRLPLPGVGNGMASLLKIAAGKALPAHGHAGTELTLVLQGAYNDELGRFACGDIADLDEHVEHQPVVDAELGCVCLIASTKPLQFKTLLGKLAQRFTRI